MSKKTHVVRIVRAVRNTSALLDYGVVRNLDIMAARGFPGFVLVNDRRALQSDTDAIAKDLWGVLKQYDERKAARN